jgi:hypothetical protein
MTFGVPPAQHVIAALNAYTRSVAEAGGPAHLADYAEIHHLLTARYLDRNGYQHAWPGVRPWPTPPLPT